MDLLKLVEQFQQKRPLRRNPEDLGVLVNEFVLELQASSGQDVAAWDEDAWIAALKKLGLKGNQIGSALENLAGWGVVDNEVYG